jgi:glycolate oxidase FAD binding subunit
MSATATITREEALARLAAIVGAEHARADGNAVGVAGGAMRVAPAGTEQIAEVLRFANEHGLAVVPTGSGSKLGWGNAVAPEIYLSLERMKAVREHAWQDLTCTVEAGCTWAAMQAELARHGQMVALDPLRPDRATVGGVVAANDSGALRLRYGGLRDLIIGMTIVLADGTVAKTGGKVVKNVAGYDLHKLMTGSFGTLGVIASVNFRLHPVEQHTQSWTVDGDRDALAELMMRVLGSTMQVSGMQMRGFDRESSDRLDIRFAGRPECLERHREQLEGMAGGLEVTRADEEVWQAREKLYDDGDARDGLVVKATMLPSQIAAAQKKLAAWQGETISVTQANGIMTAAILDRYMYGEQFVESLREFLRPGGGAVVVLRMPQTVRPKPDMWGYTPDALPLMHEIKRRFDPNRTLSPGRFVGGI